MVSERALGPGRLRRIVDADGRVSFQADFTDSAGKRRRVHVGHDARTAERVFRKLISNRDLEAVGLGGERGLDLRVQDVVERYLAELALRARPRVFEEARRALVRMVEQLEVRTLRDITKSRVADWRIRRSREGASNKTINNGVAMLAAVLNHAVELDQIAASPLAGLRALPVDEKHRVRRARALTNAELGALLRAAERRDAARPADCPQTPLLLFLLGTGARWSEAIAVRWADLDLDGGQVILRAETTKTAKARSIPLQETVADAARAMRSRLQASVGQAPDSGAPAFLDTRGRPWKSGGRVQFRRYLHALLRAAGIEIRDSAGRVVHIHAMRHTFATRLARAKVHPVMAKALTGHSTVRMLVDVYQHVAAEEARETIRALPPLTPAPEPEPPTNGHQST